jgi:glycosyltransferase involved in cell wall biosynthesis
MRILHVIDGIDVGGAELVLTQLVERLQSAGHHNTILVLSTCGPLRNRLEASGAVLLEMGMARGRIPVSGIARLVSAFRKAAPDVIQGWMYHGNLACSFLRLVSLWRAPIVWSIHNSVEPMPVLPRITRAALRLNLALSGLPAHIVYVSEASARQHERMGFRRKRTKVIPNGTDCHRFSPRPGARERMREELGVPQHVPLVGSFARWDPVKGHSFLFDAVARLLDSGVTLHLVLAGTGMDGGNRELVSALDATGLSRHVTCLGQRQDIEALMAGLDLFVLSSVESEAFPLVLGEAMATEVRCVATDVGDCRLILGETGEIVDRGDPVALAQAIEKALSAETGARVRLGRLARERIQKDYSLEGMARAYAALYESVAADASDEGDQSVGIRV